MNGYPVTSAPGEGLKCLRMEQLGRANLRYTCFTPSSVSRFYTNR